MFEHPLEERCYQFAKGIRAFCRKLKKDVENIEDIKQLVKASQLRKIFSAMLKKPEDKDPKN